MLASSSAAAAKRTSAVTMQPASRQQRLLLSTARLSCGARSYVRAATMQSARQPMRSLAAARNVCSKGPLSPSLPTAAIRSSPQIVRAGAASLRAASTKPTMTEPTESYAAVVVGGGPAGITVVGNLLEQKVEPILWVDNAFNGGRINRSYREVPSNTKVALFVEYATAVAPFRKIVSNTPSRSRWEEPSASDGVAVNGKSDKLEVLRSLDQSKSCQLSHAADMLLMLTEGLAKTPGVIPQKSQVTDATLDEANKTWTVNLTSTTPSDDSALAVSTPRFIMCTGSSPNNSPLPVNIPSLHVLDLDCALSPSLLKQTLSPLGPTSIGVIGASHSAILVLMNLYNLAKTSKPDLRITWLTRHPLRYAEQRDGWILRDNTGLKGSAAEWARTNLEPDTLPSSDVANYLTKVSYSAGSEAETYKEHLTGKDFYVQAIGYSRDPIPALKTRDGTAIEPVFDHENGHFSYTPSSSSGGKKSEKLPGLFGAGIAFPARVVDPEGNVEYAVGFFKFMKHIKKVIGSWI
ncbi:hypothetical protein Q7P37_006205 [Cladosporium fusiforme]